MSSPSAERRPEAPTRDFIREIVAQDVVSGKPASAIVTRFPPEPNGRLQALPLACLRFERVTTDQRAVGEEVVAEVLGAQVIARPLEQLA